MTFFGDKNKAAEETSKKLEAAQAENAQLNAQVNDFKAQLEAAQAENAQLKAQAKSFQEIEAAQAQLATDRQAFEAEKKAHAEWLEQPAANATVIKQGAEAAASIADDGYHSVKAAKQILNL